MLGIYIELSNSTEETQFDFLLCNFKPDNIYVKESKGFTCTSKVMSGAVKVNSASDLPCSGDLVLFAPKLSQNFTPTVSLGEFKHPEDCIYMFGSNHRHLTDEDFGGRTPDEIVYIPTDTKDDMYNWISCAVALWDRRNG